MSWWSWPAFLLVLIQFLMLFLVGYIGFAFGRYGRRS